MNNTHKNHIKCKNCGVPALAQMDETPLCMGCLFAQIGTRGLDEIHQKISPLNLEWSLDLPWMQPASM